MSIRIKFEQELRQVHNKLIHMLRAAEIAIEKSITALVKQDKDLAKEVVEDDKYLDNLEREIEQDCLKILLLEHPVARDFREVSSALKMITDLERIGDQASDICEIVLKFKDEQYIKKLEHIPTMANLTVEMLKDGIHSYINKDLQLARSLEERDDQVDELFEIIKKDLINLIKLDGNNADQAILFMMIAKYIERIGDHAVNIGEWVEFSITGYHAKNI